MDSYYFYINMGSLLGALMFFALCWKENRSWKKSFVVLLLAAAVLEAGSAAGKLVRFLSYGAGLNWQKIFIEDHGTHFIGRVIFAVTAFPLVYRMVYRGSEREWEKYLDILCIFMTFQHIFNRIACLSYGCCMGKYYNGLFAFQYASGSGTGAGRSYPVYPTQLFEITGMVLLLALLFLRYRRKKRLVYVFCGGFAATIFLSEFMMDTRGTIRVYGYSMIQFAAVLLAGIGAAYFIFRKEID